MKLFLSTFSRVNVLFDVAGVNSSCPDLCRASFSCAKLSGLSKGALVSTGSS